MEIRPTLHKEAHVTPLTTIPWQGSTISNSLYWHLWEFWGNDYYWIDGKQSIGWVITCHCFMRIFLYIHAMKLILDWLIWVRKGAPWVCSAMVWHISVGRCNKSVYRLASDSNPRVQWQTWCRTTMAGSAKGTGIVSFHCYIVGNHKMYRFLSLQSGMGCVLAVIIFKKLYQIITGP